MAEAKSQNRKTKRALIVSAVLIIVPVILSMYFKQMPIRALIVALWLIVCVILMATGSSADKASARRKDVYRTSISQADKEIDIADLAKAAGTDIDIATQDMSEMIEDGLLPGAQIDFVEKKVLFPGGGKRYAKKETSKKAGKSATADDAWEGVKAAHIESLRRCRELVSEDSIIEKLAGLEASVNKIYDRVEEHPEDAKEVDLFVSQYLPKITKSIDVYNELTEKQIPGKEVSDFKQELENSLDTYKEAFDNILSKLYQEQVIDVSTDVMALESALKNDGLLE